MSETQIKKIVSQKSDADVIQNLDFLIDMNVVEHAGDWDMLDASSAMPDEDYDDDDDHEAQERPGAK